MEGPQVGVGVTGKDATKQEFPGGGGDVDFAPLPRTLL